MTAFLDSAGTHFLYGFLVEFDYRFKAQYNFSKPFSTLHTMSTILPACIECKRYIRDLQTRMACTQYRRGIPHEIVMGQQCPFFEAKTGSQTRHKKGGK